MNESSNPWTILRVAAGVIALPLAAFVLAVFRKQIQSGVDWLGVLLAAPVGAAELICVWFVLRGQHATSRGQMKSVLTGGMIGGGIGFIPGFFGPMIFLPDSNQGPLIGVFISGPLGFATGIAMGAIVIGVRILRGSDEVSPRHKHAS